MTECSTTKKTAANWRDSRARELLFEGLAAGTIPLTSHEMLPRDVYSLHEEFKNFKYANFRTNLNNLRKNLLERKQTSKFDEKALQHDRQIVNRGSQNQRGYPFWPKSDASKLLESDLKGGQHLQSKPEILYMTRPEYQMFPISVFRDHVHQELRQQRERPYWLHKKQQKQKQARGENILEDKGEDNEACTVLY